MFTFFLLSTRKTLFRQIWSKKSKLEVKAEIWYQETKLNTMIDDLINYYKLLILAFSVFDGKYLLLLIWSKKNCQFELKFCTRLIWICRIMQKVWGVRFFCLRPEKPFLGTSGQKNKNCQFKLKFGTMTNLNKENLMMMFTFSDFDYKYL